LTLPEVIQQQLRHDRRVADEAEYAEQLFRQVHIDHVGGFIFTKGNTGPPHVVNAGLYAVFACSMLVTLLTLNNKTAKLPKQRCSAKR